MLEYISLSLASAMAGAGLGWMARQWTMFRTAGVPATKPMLSPRPVEEENPPTYLVRYVKRTKFGEYEKTAYSGDSLLEAKKTFYDSTKCAPSAYIELYTRGHHTATRKCS